MTKICFPNYNKGEFASLADALKFMRRNDNFVSRYALCNIVQYNICYRNHLRQYGIDSLIFRLLDEAPKLKQERVLLYYLRKWAKDEKLADYDIQCYNIKDKVTILGHTFNGLEDISEHFELYTRDGYGAMHHLFSVEDREYDDIHIGHFFENYPIFDSSDLSDDRTYQNYIFRSNPITESDMQEAFNVFHGFNFCRVHENIPVETLPILYYNGNGKYMLLATKR